MFTASAFTVLGAFCLYLGAVAQTSHSISSSWLLRERVAKHLNNLQNEEAKNRFRPLTRWWVPLIPWRARKYASKMHELDEELQKALLTRDERIELFLDNKSSTGWALVIIGSAIATGVSVWQTYKSPAAGLATGVILFASACVVIVRTQKSDDKRFGKHFVPKEKTVDASGDEQSTQLAIELLQRPGKYQTEKCEPEAQ